MHLVCRCSLPVWRRSFLKKGTPRDLFWPRPGSVPGGGGIWPKNNNTCKGPWVIHPYQVSSKSIKRFWRRSRKCESLQTTTDDGRTDDGRCAMTIAHSSLRLRWAKKHHFILFSQKIQEAVAASPTSREEYLSSTIPLRRKKSVSCTLHTGAFMANNEFLQKKEMNTQSAKMVSECTICICFSKNFSGRSPEPPPPAKLRRDIPLTHSWTPMHRSKIGLQPPPAVHLVSGSVTDNATYIFKGRFFMQFY